MSFLRCFDRSGRLLWERRQINPLSADTAQTEFLSLFGSAVVDSHVFAVWWNRERGESIFASSLFQPPSQLEARVVTVVTCYSIDGDLLYRQCFFREPLGMWQIETSIEVQLAGIQDNFESVSRTQFIPAHGTIAQEVYYAWVRRVEQRPSVNCTRHGVTSRNIASGGGLVCAFVARPLPTLHRYKHRWFAAIGDQLFFQSELGEHVEIGREREIVRQAVFSIDRTNLNDTTSWLQ